MHVIRRRGWELPERLATPEHLFFNRRAFLAATGARWRSSLPHRGMRSRSASPTCPTRPRTSIRPSATRHFTLDRPITDEKINTSYNNFYEFGSSKNVGQGGAGAQAAALDGQDRRHGGKAEGDRPRRSDPQDAARGAALSASLRRSLDHGDSLDRLSVCQAASNWRSRCRRPNTARWKPSSIPRWRRASGRPGIRGPTSRVSQLRKRATSSLSWSPAPTASRCRSSRARRCASRCRGNTDSSRSNRSCDSTSPTAAEELLGGFASLGIRLLGERQSAGAASALEPGHRGGDRTERARPTLLFNGYAEYVADLYKGLEKERLWA